MRGYELAEMFQGCECLLDVQWLIEGWSGEFTVDAVHERCSTHKVVGHILGAHAAVDASGDDTSAAE